MAILKMINLDEETDKIWKQLPNKSEWVRQSLRNIKPSTEKPEDFQLITNVLSGSSDTTPELDKTSKQPEANSSETAHTARKTRRYSRKEPEDVMMKLSQKQVNTAKRAQPS